MRPSIGEINSRLDSAYAFLDKNLPANRIFPSYVSPTRQMCRLDLEVSEIFSTALIAEALPQGNSLRHKILETFYHLAKAHKLFTFYTAPVYPPDTDTNALIFSLLLEEGFDVKSEAYKLWRVIERFSDYNGIVRVWLSNDRQQQIDAIVCINAEILAVKSGLKRQSSRNRKYIIKHLTSGNYWNGTRYYHSPDAFLYFLRRLAVADKIFENQIKEEIIKAAKERCGTTCHPLDLAHRLIVYLWLGIDYDFELKKLLSLQQKDGSLPIDAMFHFGARRGYFGSRFLTTAYFIKAFEILKNNQYETQQKFKSRT